MKKLLLLLVIILFPLNCEAAEKLHALAMHGEPLYSADYKSFGYVNAVAPKGGVLKQARNGTFDNLNRVVIFGNEAAGLDYMYDKLMVRAWDEPFTLYGLVAKDIEIADDRSWIIFDIDERARFHDGTPMTAEDVKFSFEAYRDYGHPVRRRVYGLVNKVEIINDHRIKFTFGEGYDRESALILALMEIMPKHYWQDKDISRTTLVPPLGSGPYKIKDVEPGRKITYERVKDYWAKDLPAMKGLYNFDTLIFNYYRDDNIALQSFKAGDYDFRREADIQKWETDYSFKALSEGRVVKDEIKHGRPEWVRGIIFNTRREPFGDIKVRQALNLLFDFDWINKNFFFNSFKRLNSIFANSALAAFPPEENQSSNYDERVNKREAINLLKEAGFEYKEQKLINSKTGKQLSFEILVNDPSDEKIVLSYSRTLEKVGIEVKIRSVDSAQFTGRLDDFDYDMVVYRWINSLSPGNEQLNYWGSAASDNNGSRNYAGIKDKNIDDIAASIAHSLTREELEASCKALDKAVMQGHYFIPLYYLGKDLLARDVNVAIPEKTPIYGIVQETWWAKNYEKQ